MQGVPSASLQPAAAPVGFPARRYSSPAGVRGRGAAADSAAGSTRARASVGAGRASGRPRPRGGIIRVWWHRALVCGRRGAGGDVDS